MTVYAKLWPYVDGAGQPQVCIEARKTPNGATYTTYQVPDHTWLSIANGAIVAATSAPPVPLPKQAEAMLAGGLTISSTSGPSLNGTYAADPTTQVQIQAEIISLLQNKLFANGTTSLAYPDIDNEPHTFTSVQFQNFATAMGLFVSSITAVVRGHSTTLPSNSVTIP